MTLHRWLYATLALFVTTTAAAQAPDPRTLPRLTSLAGVTAAGSITYDWSDGAGGDISYGAGALGLSEDGKYIYVSCVQDHAGFAKLTIPAIGGRATVAAPCLGPRKAEIAKVHPDPSAYRPMLGGILWQNGRVCVTGYISYDADGTANASHWCGPNLSQLAGPFRGTVSPGLTAGPMVPVPQEWQALLGGPALTSLYLKSIVSRSSYGFTASAFDPALVTGPNFPMSMLIACRHVDPGCNTYQNDGVGKDQYQGAELSGGFFIVPGTRTLVAIEREAAGPACYGYTTRNQADHGKPYLDAVYCYSLADPLDQKGPKGYPYKLVAKLYDLNDLADVKAGTKQPWTIRQYATLDMPGSSDKEFVTASAFDPVLGRLYLARGAGGGINSLYVYDGWPKAGTTPTPTPTNCVPGTTVYTFVSQTACVANPADPTVGIRTVTESWVRTGDTPPTNGGLACEPTTGTRTRDEACTPAPPPPTPEFPGRIRAQSIVSAGLRLTLDVNAAAAVPPVGTAVRVLINGIPYNATIFDVDPSYYAGTPRSTRVIVTIPGLSFLAVTVQVP